LWVGLEQRDWPGQIYAVGVSNASGDLTPDDFRPCAVVVDTGAYVPGRVPPRPRPGVTQATYGSLVLYLGQPGSDVFSAKMVRGRNAAETQP
jgi:hypothetical protein